MVAALRPNAPCFSYFHSTAPGISLRIFSGLRRREGVSSSHDSIHPLGIMATYECAAKHKSKSACLVQASEATRLTNTAAKT
eukprot:6266925-Amphidinium_carterae.1